MRANINDEQRRQCARDKQPAPPENWEDDPVNQRGQEIPKGVALLQNSGEQTTRGRWQRFHCERCTQAPFAAHPDPEKGAQQQKRPEIRRERGQQFDDRIKDKGKEKEIERIQGPPEETSNESVALCTVQRFEEPDRFHAESTKCQI